VQFGAALPIPLWLGGEHARAMRRAIRLADGFIPLHDLTALHRLKGAREELAAALR
jgi:hypothetical protein